MKTLFITGSSGFLDSHLLNLLNTKKYKIKCFDKIPPNHNNIEFIQGDILIPESYSKYLKNTEVVIHLAASVKSDKDTYNINANGTKNLIEQCKKHKISRFIHISSMSAYIDSIYGISKRDSELLVLNSNLDYTILRPPLIIGKNSHGFARIVEAIKKYPLVPVIGSGNYKINPVYVKDVAQAIVNCIDNKKSLRKSYNVAGPNIITYNNFINLTMKTLNINKKLLHIPIPICYLLAYLTNTVTVGGIKTLSKDTYLDIIKTKKDLNYNPVSLDKALKEILTN